MTEAQHSRRPTRDYRALSENPWSLWELMFARRSCRKYAEGVLPEGLAGELDPVLSLALEVRGAPSGSLIAVTDPRTGEELRRRSYKGFANKINLWLMRAPVNAFLVMAVSGGDTEKGRPRELPVASMAAEDCVLWLTGRGLGTCWLGGVNSEEVKSVLGLDAGLHVPCVVCFGAPRSSPPVISLDNFMRNAFSRKRKPVRAVASVETMEESYVAEDMSPSGFSASPVQDVAGLLEELRDGRGDGGAPLELAVEACLEAARIAPSAGNFQAWHFVVVRNGGRLAELERACGLEDASWRAAIVAAGIPSKVAAGVFEKPFWMVDVPIALSHMSLMAASMGCAARVHVHDIDEGAVNSLIRASGRARAVGVMGIL